ncbi:hypothetical protein FQR65_LT18004 [Abscondita terminalis]|nr:hypothetical protein FQR65_LT18004 [Abscondita terminalis]
MPPKKASQQQYQLLIDEVAKSSCLRWGKGTPDEKKEAWEQISLVLNAVGAIEKTPDAWKKAFVEMKSHVKAKIRDAKQLNATEKRCADILGLYASCSGITSVPELGMASDVNDNNKEDPLQEQDQLLTETAVCNTQSIDEHEGKDGPEEEVENESDRATQPKKKQKPKLAHSSVVSTFLVLLSDHMEATNRSLQNIATAIQSVADAINNVAVSLALKPT